MHKLFKPKSVDPDSKPRFGRYASLYEGIARQERWCLKAGLTVVAAGTLLACGANYALFHGKTAHTDQPKAETFQTIQR
jgi:hypothetical protein